MKIIILSPKQDTLRDQCDPSSDCLRNCCTNGIVAPLYFVVFVLLAQFVLVNVVVAVLMKHLEESHKYMEEDEDYEIDMEIAREIEREKEEEAKEKMAVQEKERKEREMKHFGKKKKKKTIIKVSSLPSNFTFTAICDRSAAFERNNEKLVGKSSKEGDTNGDANDLDPEKNGDASFGAQKDGGTVEKSSLEGNLSGEKLSDEKTEKAPKITITSSITSMALSSTMNTIGTLFSRSSLKRGGSKKGKGRSKDENGRSQGESGRSQKQRPVIMIDDISDYDNYDLIDQDANSSARADDELSGDISNLGACLSPKEKDVERKWSDVTMIDEDTANISSYLITNYPELTDAKVASDAKQNDSNHDSFDEEWKGQKDGSLSSISSGSLSN